jgi:hypothetical protein
MDEEWGKWLMKQVKKRRIKCEKKESAVGIKKNRRIDHPSLEPLLVFLSLFTVARKPYADTEASFRGTAFFRRSIPNPTPFTIMNDSKAAFSSSVFDDFS